MEKLYEALYDSGKYTKSFDDFKSQFSSLEGQEKLYKALNKSGDYTKSFNNFSNQFFGGSVKVNDSASADPAVESSSDTGSKSESGSSGLLNNVLNYFNINEDYSDTQEKNTKLENFFGKNVITDALGDLWRAGVSGKIQSDTLSSSLKYFSEGSSMSEEDFRELVETGRDLENAPQTDEMLAFNKRYDEIRKDSQNMTPGDDKGLSGFAGDTLAFMRGWWENPTAMTQYSAQSLTNMAYSAARNPGKVIAGGATLAGIAKIAQGLGWRGKLISVPMSFIAGSLGTTSAVMETGFTTADLVRDVAMDEGLDWQNMSDTERLNFYKSVASNEKLFGDLKSKAIARGVSIGSVDAVTALALPGINRATRNRVSASSASRFTRGAQILAVGGAETAGGLISEVAGQAAAGQGFDSREILIEGFADKTLTLGYAVNALRNKPPSYFIKGQGKMNGKEFIEALEIMDDEAYVAADIKIENSPYLQKIVDDRRSNIAFDQKVDSRINGVEDRAKTIKLKREQASLDNNKEGNATRLLEIQIELNEIQNKYKDNPVDVTIEQRKQAVANAVDNKFEAEFNKNYRATKEGAEKIGIKTNLFLDTESYLAAIEEAFGYIPEGANTSDGVFVGNGQIFVNKEQARKSINIATGNNGAISVASHEVLHPIFNVLIGNAKEQTQFVKDFKKLLTKEQKKYIDQRLKAYSGNQEGIELMNIFSDGIIKGDITYEQSSFEKIGQAIINFFRSALGLTTNEINFEDARGVYNFLKEYNTSIKEGKLSDKAIQAVKEAEQKQGKKVSEAQILKQEQFSKTLSDDVKQSVIEKIKELQKLKEEGIALAKRFGKDPIKSPKESRLEQEILEAISPLVEKIVTNRTKALYDPIAADAKQNVTREEFQESLRSDIQTMVLNEYKAGIQDLEKFIVNRSYLRANNLAQRLGIESVEEGGIKLDVDTAKNVTDTTETDVETTKKPTKQRGQATFKELDVVDDDVVTEIENDIAREIRVRTQKGTLSETFNVKKGRKNYIVNWVERYIDKVVFKILSKKLGAIGEKDGNVVIPPAYIDFLQNDKVFDIITKSLSIKSIKKSYGKLFNIEQVGREQTPEGNPIFKINKINKQEFFKYFVEGKKSTILERQKQLFREILTPIVKEAVAKYATPENLVKLKEIQSLAPEQAVDIVENIVIEAQLQELESKIDRYKGEDKSFDIIQFAQNDIANYDSKVVNTRSLKQAVRLDEDSNEFLILPDSLKNAALFVKENLQLKGTTIGGLIYELLTLERIDAFSAGKIIVKTLRGELGGFDSNRPDIEVKVKKGRKEIEANIELKQGPSARFGQTTLGYDQNAKENFKIRSKRKNPDGSLKQMSFDDVPTGKQLKAALGKAEKHLKSILKLINKLEKKKFTGFPLGGSISITTVEEIKKSKAYKELAKISTDADGKTVSDHYNAKDTYLIQIGGIGLYTMGNDVFGFNNNIKDVNDMVPSLNNLEFKGVMRLKFNYNRKKGTASVSLISEPVLKNKKDLKKSPINLDTKRGVTAFSDRIQFSKSMQGDTFGMADVVSNRLFNKVYSKLTPSQKNKVRAEMISHKLIQFSQKNISNINKARQMANRPDAPVKGISVWDFDDTLARTNSNVLYTLPNGKKGKLNATEFALRSGELEAQGAKFDFSEFEKVIKGRKGPMFEKALARNKKFGNANVFILTARPDSAKYAIHEFLKGIGLNIRLENIIGLSDGDPQAKANWVISKVAEGYNDFYFADDAYKNVKAVQEVLEAADVKSKVHQAKVQFSQNLNKEFNKILEGVTGIPADETISEAMSRIKARLNEKFRFFVPFSAEDFAGLLYYLLGKGKVGEQQQAWFKEALFDPFARGIYEFEKYKQNLTVTIEALKDQLTDIPNSLSDENILGFTNEVAIRVYLWKRNGYDIKELSQREIDGLIAIVENNFLFKSFADQLDATLDGYPPPQGDWLSGGITIDALNMINTSKRSDFLTEWQQNVDEIFTEEAYNKMRSQFGDGYVDALKDILYRMKTGRNRPAGSNKLTNQFMNWVNDSVGTIMFFNTRSALLQTLSIVNFINWGDNNPALAAEAFDNQEQFWKDFAFIFNSDFLKQRRSGLKNDVNADDIANAAKTSTNKVSAALSAILKIGFLPTQMADSFAIAMGGASFLRNRINTYLKQGMDQKAAEEKAFLDFKEIAEETQQSSRPDRISQQQASPLGRLILAFANTPMQYMRLTKKAYLDLINGRGDMKTNITKILYYSTVQNIIFSSLQSALFMMAFDDSDEELMEGKMQFAANNVLDTFLRGSGIYGAGVAMMKNILLEVNKQSKKDRPDYTQAGLKMLSLSPPVDSKIRKLLSAGRAFSYKSVREKMVGYSLENPAFYAIGQIVSAFTNVPLDRLVRKARHVQIATTGDVAFWQRVALLLGYSEWDLGLIETSSSKKKKFGRTSKWKKRQ
jgi:hypothetical protein